MSEELAAGGGAARNPDAADAGRPVGWLEKKLLMAVMPLLFRSVFGWRERAPQGCPDAAQYFDVQGVDGSVLKAARYAATRGEPKGVVLLCHPFLKYGMAYFFRNGYQDWLNRAGYHVVGFNFKGFGQSSRGGMAFSDDVASLAQWARGQHPGLPLHLLGASFGAYHAIHSVGHGGLRFASVVFDSVPARISSFFGEGLVGLAMRSLSRSRWARPTGTEAITASLPALRHTPCLFMYGSGDGFITEDDIGKVRALCQHARVSIFPDCGHLEIRKAHPERYTGAITDFFDQHGAGAQSLAAHTYVHTYVQTHAHTQEKL